MQYSIYHNAETDRQYRAATGLSLVESEALFHRFASLYVPKSPAVVGGRKEPVLTDKRGAFFYFVRM